MGCLKRGGEGQEESEKENNSMCIWDPANQLRIVSQTIPPSDTDCFELFQKQTVGNSYELFREQSLRPSYKNAFVLAPSPPAATVDSVYWYGNDTHC